MKNKVDHLYKKLFDITAQIGRIQAECPHKDVKKSLEVVAYDIAGPGTRSYTVRCECQVCRKTWDDATIVDEFISMDGGEMKRRSDE